MPRQGAEGDGFQRKGCGVRGAGKKAGSAGPQGARRLDPELLRHSPEWTGQGRRVKRRTSAVQGLLCFGRGTQVESLLTCSPGWLQTPGNPPASAPSSAVTSMRHHVPTFQLTPASPRGSLPPAWHPFPRSWKTTEALVPGQDRVSLGTGHTAGWGDVSKSPASTESAPGAPLV